jgi:hypothetical protein
MIRSIPKLRLLATLAALVVTTTLSGCADAAAPSGSDAPSLDESCAEGQGWANRSCPASITAPQGTLPASASDA